MDQAVAYEECPRRVKGCQTTTTDNRYDNDYDDYNFRHQRVAKQQRQQQNQSLRPRSRSHSRVRTEQSEQKHKDNVSEMRYGRRTEVKYIDNSNDDRASIRIGQRSNSTRRHLQQQEDVQEEREDNVYDTIHIDRNNTRNNNNRIHKDKRTMRVQNLHHHQDTEERDSYGPQHLQLPDYNNNIHRIPNAESNISRLIQNHRIEKRSLKQKKEKVNNNTTSRNDEKGTSSRLRIGHHSTIDATVDDIRHRKDTLTYDSKINFARLARKYQQPQQTQQQQSSSSTSVDKYTVTDDDESFQNDNDAITNICRRKEQNMYERMIQKNYKDSAIKIAESTTSTGSTAAATIYDTNYNNIPSPNKQQHQSQQQHRSKSRTTISPSKYSSSYNDTTTISNLTPDNTTITTTTGTGSNINVISPRKQQQQQQQRSRSRSRSLSRIYPNRNEVCTTSEVTPYIAAPRCSRPAGNTEVLKPSQTIATNRRVNIDTSHDNVVYEDFEDSDNDDEHDVIKLLIDHRCHNCCQCRCYCTPNKSTSNKLNVIQTNRNRNVTKATTNVTIIPRKKNNNNRNNSCIESSSDYNNNGVKNVAKILIRRRRIKQSWHNVVDDEQKSNNHFYCDIQPEPASSNDNSSVPKVQQTQLQKKGSKKDLLQIQLRSSITTTGSSIQKKKYHNRRRRGRSGRPIRSIEIVGLKRIRSNLSVQRGFSEVSKIQGKVPSQRRPTIPDNNNNNADTNTNSQVNTSKSVVQTNHLVAINKTRNLQQLKQRKKTRYHSDVSKMNPSDESHAFSRGRKNNVSNSISDKNEVTDGNHQQQEAHKQQQQQQQQQWYSDNYTINTVDSDCMTVVQSNKFVPQTQNKQQEQQQQVQSQSQPPPQPVQVSLSPSSMNRRRAKQQQYRSMMQLLSYLQQQQQQQKNDFNQSAEYDEVVDIIKSILLRQQQQHQMKKQQQKPVQVQNQQMPSSLLSSSLPSNKKHTNDTTTTKTAVVATSVPATTSSPTKQEGTSAFHKFVKAPNKSDFLRSLAPKLRTMLSDLTAETRNAKNESDKRCNKYRAFIDNTLSSTISQASSQQQQQQQQQNLQQDNTHATNNLKSLKISTASIGADQNTIFDYIERVVSPHGPEPVPQQMPIESVSSPTMKFIEGMTNSTTVAAKAFVKDPDVIYDVCFHPSNLTTVTSGATTKKYPVGPDAPGEKITGTELVQCLLSGRRKDIHRRNCPDPPLNDDNNKNDDTDTSSIVSDNSVELRPKEEVPRDNAPTPTKRLEQEQEIHYQQQQQQAQKQLQPRKYLTVLTSPAGMSQRPMLSVLSPSAVFFQGKRTKHNTVNTSSTQPPGRHYDFPDDNSILEGEPIDSTIYKEPGETNDNHHPLVPVSSLKSDVAMPYATGTGGKVSIDHRVPVIIHDNRSINFDDLTTLLSDTTHTTTDIVRRVGCFGPTAMIDHYRIDEDAFTYTTGGSWSLSSWGSSGSYEEQQQQQQQQQQYQVQGGKDGSITDSTFYPNYQVTKGEIGIEAILNEEFFL